MMLASCNKNTLQITMENPDTTQTQEWIIAGVIVVTSIFILTGLIFAIFKQGFQSSEAAGWTQALGSFAAIVAAVWLSRMQERKLKNDALVTAQVIGASMVFQLAQVVSNTQKSLEWFDQVGRADGDYREFEKHLVILESQPQWKAEDLAKLTPLPNNCAYKMAAGIDRINTAIGLIKEARANDGIRTDNFLRMQYAGKIASALNEGTLCFEIAAQRIQAAVHKFTSPYNG
ncbi:hypothetical protein [Janthinobacterium violaceinigrum]|uniref:Uncharacterized protein n=1 Tax=Janthinobacterium violaceinigrum TaxID=2654252 RepID=A0A6I1IFV4_9BURK|nr:hypothetical protein [Janthinobacterium violaceinigrum]KAB8066248.1 hypothetical protein GCN75_03365 [Janthinobacterium violaceinigrum]